MSKAQWEPDGEGNQLTYTWKAFTLTRYSMIGGGSLWEAKHHGQSVKRDQDLQTVMDYCEQLDKRVSE